MSIAFSSMRIPGRTSVRTTLDVAIGIVTGIGLLAGLHLINSPADSFTLMTLGTVGIGALVGTAARWVIARPGIGLGAGVTMVLVVVTNPVSPFGWFPWDGYPGWLQVDLGAAAALAGALLGLPGARMIGHPARPEQPDPGS